MTNLSQLTAQIVANFVANNGVRSDDLPNLIGSVHQSLANLANPSAQPSSEPVAKPTRAQIRKSINDDGLVSFEDGKIYKILTRSLAARGLTPEAYRQKWSLPADYPMTAPSVSLAKSAGAKARWFGRKSAKASVDVGPVLEPRIDPSPTIKPRSGGPTM